MNKADLILRVSAEAGVSRKQAHRAIDALTQGITTTLRRGGRVSLIGFGVFTAPKRAARPGRNPRTGAQFKVKARRAAKFAASPNLKAMCQPEDAT